MPLREWIPKLEKHSGTASILHFIPTRIQRSWSYACCHRSSTAPPTAFSARERRNMAEGGPIVLKPNICLLRSKGFRRFRPSFRPETSTKMLVP